MATVRITPGQLGPALRRHFRRKRQQMKAASLSVAHRGVAHAVELTHQGGHVHTGAYARAFQAKPTPEGAILGNSAPYASVIEFGRRPGAPGPPLAPIHEWVRLKLGLTGPELERAAWAIRRAIHENGSPPRAILSRTRRQMKIWLRAELRRRLSQP